ncbi:MAG: KUP/HAK/KT family potassium transporter, partial [Gemmatimonadales bacterium]
NVALMLVTFALVLGFQSASGMAAAYGVAVSSEMILTTVLLFFLCRKVWGWSLLRSALLCGFFGLVELAFWVANALKIPHGGWFPLAIAAAVYLVMTTWRRGREILGKRLMEKSVPLNLLLADLAAEPPTRVPGTAVFLTGAPQGTPPALIHNLAHNKVLHEKVIFLTVLTEEIPHVPPAERVQVKRLGKGFYAVTARYGFMEDPDVPEILELCKEQGLDVPVTGTTFFIGRETLIATDRPGMALWREKVFSFLSRNALRATAFFKIPADQVFEVGAQVEL